ncbi:MAG: D-aminoacyl-tRNA deacylase [Thermoplasmata archaeon]|nr:D-aminoacyl-tRNA deacylase [Thermoplasmata archaeon]MCI4353955.1 D-aminoacyl-tRNA deacylase [Thermoplasmata archaeon]
MTPYTLLIVSEADPVAPLVAAHWGTPPSDGAFVEGTPIRRMGPEMGMLRRPGLHIHDDHLDRLPPAEIGRRLPTLVFPSVHRSESGQPCFTVHPLGNPGDSAEVGGRPRRLVPTAPRRMADALRRLSEAGGPIGLSATYEATHHGPALDAPAFFAEIGYGDAPGPSPESVRALSQVLPALAEDPLDRVAVGAGGGHYVPHFTDLAIRRRWAFGHLLSRHALEAGPPDLIREAIAKSPGADGVLFARAADAADPRWLGAGARLRDADAPRRTTSGP